MAKLFRITASSSEAYQHYIDTIERGFSLNSISHFLTEKQVSFLKDVYHDKGIRAWGATPGPGNARTWEKMDVGDPILIYRKKNFEYYAFVSFKIHSPELAKHLWGTDAKGETWEYIYFLDKLTDISVPAKIFNDLIGYDEGFSPYGFTITDKNKVEALEERFGSVYGFLNYLAEGKWVEREVNMPQKVKEYIVEDRLKRQLGGATLLEANLENLLVQNVEAIEPGMKLIDRQLDTKEVGRLDLLTEDKDGDLVVVELKRAAAGPSIIDQTQRYMGWVMKHVARDGQRVRGVIVVGSRDAALEYAVSANPNVEVRQFTVSLS